MYIKKLNFLFLLLISTVFLKGAPVSFQSLGSELEAFDNECKVYSKIEGMSHDIQKKCKKFTQNINKSFKDGYHLDKILASGRENEKLLNKYLKMLRSNDEEKQKIIGLISKLKSKARKDINHKLYQELIQSPHISLYDVDYTFMEEYSDIYENTNKYKQYIKNQKKRKQEQLKQEELARQKKSNRLYWYGVKYYNKYHYKAAENYMIKAAELGHFKAQKVLIKLYTNGKGNVQKDQKKVQFWQNKIYINKCQKSDENACSKLLDNYMNKSFSLLKEDKDNMLKIFTKRCQDGNTLICKKLGYIYQSGIREKQNIDLAISAYKQACKLKDQISCVKVGNIALSNTNNSLAAKYYEKACFLESLDSCNKALDIYKNVNNVKKIAALSEQACLSGNGALCQELGYKYKKEQRINKAIPFFNKACTEGFSESCVLLGDMYTTGDSVNKDLKKGKFFYIQAYNLGNGRSIPKDIKRQIKAKQQRKKDQNKKTNTNKRLSSDKRLSYDSDEYNRIKLELEKFTCHELSGNIVQKIDRNTYEIVLSQYILGKNYYENILLKTIDTEYTSKGTTTIFVKNAYDTTAVQTNDGFTKRWKVYKECSGHKRWLKLNSRFYSLKKVHELQEDLRKDGLSENEIREWSKVIKYGSDEVKGWKKLGLSLNEIQRWVDAGVTKHISPPWAHVRDYLKAGIVDPNIPLKWRNAGFSTSEALVWLKLGIKSPNTAKKWGSSGFARASNATSWIKTGMSPKKSRIWSDAGYSAHSAQEWIKTGITSPDIANRWRYCSEVSSISAHTAQYKRKRGMNTPPKCKRYYNETSRKSL